MRKYEFTGETQNIECTGKVITLRRIRAARDFMGVERKSWEAGSRRRTISRILEMRGCLEMRRCLEMRGCLEMHGCMT